MKLRECCKLALPSLQVRYIRAKVQRRGSVETAPGEHLGNSGERAENRKRDGGKARKINLFLTGSRDPLFFAQGIIERITSAT